MALIARRADALEALAAEIRAGGGSASVHAGGPGGRPGRARGGGGRRRGAGPAGRGGLRRRDEHPRPGPERAQPAGLGRPAAGQPERGLRRHPGRPASDAQPGRRAADLRLVGGGAAPGRLRGRLPGDEARPGGAGARHARGGTGQRHPHHRHLPRPDRDAPAEQAPGARRRRKWWRKPCSRKTSPGPASSSPASPPGPGCRSCSSCRAPCSRSPDAGRADRRQRRWAGGPTGWKASVSEPYVTGRRIAHSTAGIDVPSGCWRRSSTSTSAQITSRSPSL